MSTNQDLMTRLFRSIGGNSNADLIKVAKKIIESEKAKGHKKYASTLESILEKAVKQGHASSSELKSLFSVRSVIPTDKRYSTPLATYVERENLRHEMVLPVKLEEHIKRIEREYAARERLAHFGLKPRQKILLYGSSGCGKSMSAERIAWNTGLPFLKVRFEAIMSSYLGESANNLKKLFDSIKDYPCVLLLDEFDFIAKARQGGQDVGEIHRIVNVLLNLLEDYNAPGILVATTNLEGSLDTAVFRRFDDVIEIPKPGKSEIAKLLKMNLSAVRVSKDVKWSELSKMMEGLSAANIVKIAKDSAKHTVIEGGQIVEKNHILTTLKDVSKHDKHV